jgi:hypothetical protein
MAMKSHCAQLKEAVKKVFLNAGDTDNTGKR